MPIKQASSPTLSNDCEPSYRTTFPIFPSSLVWHSTETQAECCVGFPESSVAQGEVALSPIPSSILLFGKWLRRGLKLPNATGILDAKKPVTSEGRIRVRQEGLCISCDNGVTLQTLDSIVLDFLYVQKN